jgi:putative FmdB family regulatory protein
MVFSLRDTHQSQKDQNGRLLPTTYCFGGIDMPTYGYRCTACSHEFEREQRITEEPIKVCERCDAPVKKIIYPVGISFKGSGFYVNDYKGSGPAATPAPVTTTTESAPAAAATPAPAATPSTPKE